MRIEDLLTNYFYDVPVAVLAADWDNNRTATPVSGDVLALHK